MLTRTVMLAVLVMLVLPAFSQTATAPAPATGPAATAPVEHSSGGDDATVPAAKEPAGAVTGTVIGTDVNIRSGPSTSGAYICAKVHAPAKVTVVKSQGDWLQVLPTAGCHSVVAKKFITADDGGKTGTINTDGVYARVGGDLCAWTQVTQFWQVHTQLNTGAKVEILGTAGDFYKITPPSGCYYWISSKFVDLGGKKPATSEPAETTGTGGSVTVEVTPETATKPAAKLPVVESTARTQFQAVEKEMTAEFKKPIEQQDFAGIIAKYEAIKVGEDKYLKQSVDGRIAFLQTQLAVLKERDDRTKEIEAIKKRDLELQARIKEITIEKSKPSATAFAATGVLMASSAFPGTEVTPKRWAVYDPDMKVVCAYAQCTTGAVKLADYTGKIVGITGSTQYDRDLKLYIVEAKEVKILSEEGKLPTPAQPALAPETKELPPVDATRQKTDKKEGPVPPDDTPKGEPGTAPASEPATKPAKEAKLPPTGLKTADEK